MRRFDHKASNVIVSPPPLPVAAAAIHSYVMVLLFPSFVGFLFGPCFVMQYLEPFLVLQSFC